MSVHGRVQSIGSRAERDPLQHLAIPRGDDASALGKWTPGLERITVREFQPCVNRRRGGSRPVVTRPVHSKFRVL